MAFQSTSVTWRTSAGPLGSVRLGRGGWPAAHVQSGWPARSLSFSYWEESLLRFAAQHSSSPCWDSSESCHRCLLQGENERNDTVTSSPFVKHYSVINQCQMRYILGEPKLRALGVLRLRPVRRVTMGSSSSCSPGSSSMGGTIRQTYVWSWYNCRCWSIHTTIWMSWACSDIYRVWYIIYIMQIFSERLVLHC